MLLVKCGFILTGWVTTNMSIARPWWRQHPRPTHQQQQILIIMDLHRFYVINSFRPTMHILQTEKRKSCTVIVINVGVTGVQCCCHKCAMLVSQVCTHSEKQQSNWHQEINDGISCWQYSPASTTIQLTMTLQMDAYYGWPRSYWAEALTAFLSEL